MKKLLVFLIIIVSAISFSDEVIGKFLTQKESSGQIIVELYTIDNKLYGKINKIVEGKLIYDENNPDPNKRNNKLEGSIFMTDFTYNPNTKTYERGYIYDASSGNTYAANIEFLSNGNVKFRGYLKAIPFLGKTHIWTRVN